MPYPNEQAPGMPVIGQADAGNGITPELGVNAATTTAGGNTGNVGNQAGLLSQHFGTLLNQNTESEAALKNDMAMLKMLNDSYSTQHKPPQYSHLDFAPGINEPIQVGVHQSKTLGSVPIFAPTGQYFPFGVLATERAYNRERAASALHKQLTGVVHEPPKGPIQYKAAIDAAYWKGIEEIDKYAQQLGPMGWPMIQQGHSSMSIKYNRFISNMNTMAHQLDVLTATAAELAELEGDFHVSEQALEAANKVISGVIGIAADGTLLDIDIGEALLDMQVHLGLEKMMQQEWSTIWAAADIDAEIGVMKEKGANDKEIAAWVIETTKRISEPRLEAMAEALQKRYPNRIGDGKTYTIEDIKDYIQAWHGEQTNKQLQSMGSDTNINISQITPKDVSPVKHHVESTVASLVSQTRLEYPLTKDEKGKVIPIPALTMDGLSTPPAETSRVMVFGKDERIIAGSIGVIGVFGGRKEMATFNNPSDAAKVIVGASANVLGFGTGYSQADAMLALDTDQLVYRNLRNTHGYRGQSFLDALGLSFGDLANSEMIKINPGFTREEFSEHLKDFRSGATKASSLSYKERIGTLNYLGKEHAMRTNALVHGFGAVVVGKDTYIRGVKVGTVPSKIDKKTPQVSLTYSVEHNYVTQDGALLTADMLKDVGGTPGFKSKFINMLVGEDYHVIPTERGESIFIPGLSWRPSSLDEDIWVLHTEDANRQDAIDKVNVTSKQLFGGVDSEFTNMDNMIQAPTRDTSADNARYTNNPSGGKPVSIHTNILDPNKNPELNHLLTLYGRTNTEKTKQEQVDMYADEGYQELLREALRKNTGGVGAFSAQDVADLEEKYDIMVSQRQPKK